MPRLTEPYLEEFNQEHTATRKVLERAPADRLTWKPHERAMSLGQLAWHIASGPGEVAKMVSSESMDVGKAEYTFQEPESHEAILGEFDRSMTEARAYLSGLSDEEAGAPWTLLSNDEVIMQMPRLTAIRMIMFNHLYHHRGQLVTYLRMLDCKVPAVYGNSADEDPFGMG